MTSLVLALAQLTLAAQASQATIAGTVRDSKLHAPLAAVLVVLPDLDRYTITDDSGRYVLVGVPPGPQHVVLRLIGYGHRTLHALVPPEGRLEINVSLEAEPIPLDALAVQKPVAVRGHDAASERATALDRSLSVAALRNHPQLAEPDPFLAMAGGEIVMKPETPAGIHIRGGAADQTAYVIDGIPVFSPYHAGGLFSAWNPDAIARLDLLSASPSPALPDALSGVLAATTRAPGRRYTAQTSVSTTHARLTVDGPLGDDAGVLLSVRSGFPGGFGVHGEPTYLRGETDDLLARFRATLAGGALNVLRYESENEIDAARAVPLDAAPGLGPGRNQFEWRSESTGATWSRAFAQANLSMTGWHAVSGSGADWALEQDAEARLSAQRRETGVLATIAWTGPASRTLAGVRLVQNRTRYRVSTTTGGTALDSRTPVSTAIVEHGRVIGTTRVQLGAALAHGAGRARLSPRVSLEWSPAAPVTLSAAVARLHQFSQSLRNSESVVGAIFPADLYVGAGEHVPVARSEQVVAGAEYRPVAGVRVAAQAWARRLEGLVLVAPRDGEPFAFASDAAGGFTTGWAHARGISIDASLSGAHYAALASWGWQRARFAHADSGYTPDHAARHSLEAGLIVFPGATWSVRAGATGVLGRRTTAIPGAFEFESCNLLDAGCEFSGSPHYGGAVLGGTRLPAYFRVDFGARKHWDIDLAGRHAVVALYGTITNVFARRNVLTWAIDADTGERTPVELRPAAPLVVGIDWRF
ncbi:MAG: TonB-dependent receptor [Gemmatimonadetes bacterium]|nr:TonB-dependent receptor [Gemmatimonadota bacterium]